MPFVGLTRLAEEEGIQPSVVLAGLTPVFGTGDFSNSSTPPCEELWSAAADLNRAHRVCSSAAHHLLLRRLAPGPEGAPGIRTDTGRGLSTSPLPVGLRACGVRGETRTRNNAALNRTRLPNCTTRTLVCSQGFEPWMFPEGLPGLQPGAFSLSANCPNTNCQRSGGRQAIRTPMSRRTLA